MYIQADEIIILYKQRKEVHTSTCGVLTSFYTNCLLAAAHHLAHTQWASSVLPTPNNIMHVPHCLLSGGGINALCKNSQSRGGISVGGLH